jgi:hypothetical protein
MTAFTKDLTAADAHTNTALGNDGKRKRREWTLEEHEAFVAVGEGPTHERLRDLYDTNLRARPDWSPDDNFASAWVQLGSDQDEIRAEESGEAAARVAEEAARRRALKGTSKMNKGEQVGGLLDAVASVYAEGELSKQEREYVLNGVMESYSGFTGRDGLADIKAAVAAKASSNAPVTKSRLTDAAHSLGDAGRREGESVAAARARYWESDQGRTLYSAMKRMPADAPTQRAAPALSSGMQAFIKVAAERAAKTGLPVNVVKLSIAESRNPTDVALWRAARA